MMTPADAHSAIEDALRHQIGPLPPGTITVVPDDSEPGYNWTIQVHGGGTAQADGAALTHHQEIMARFEVVRNANPFLDFCAG